MKTQKEIDTIRQEIEIFQRDLDTLKESLRRAEEKLAAEPAYPREPGVSSLVTWYSRANIGNSIRWVAVHRVEGTQRGLRDGIRDGWLMSDHEDKRDSRWMTWEEIVDFARGLDDVTGFGQATMMKSIDI